MRTFPFLTLPPKVCDKVLIHLSFPDLFNLAQLSKKAVKLVKIHCKSLEVPPSLSISLGSSCNVQVDHIASRRRIRRIIWDFYHTRNPKILDLRNPKAYKFASRTIIFCRRGALFASPAQLTTEEIIGFIGYIKDLFKARITLMYSDNIRMDHFHKLRSLRSFRSIGFLIVGEGRVSHEVMRQMLECRVCIELEIKCEPAPNFVVNFPIPSRSLVVHNGSWIQKELLLNLDCRKAKLMKCTLTDENLNQFLLHWVQSDNHKLHHIIICNQNGTWDFAKIVSGLPTFPGSPKRQEASSYQEEHVAYENGLDFRRPTDGMLGTVIKSDKNEFLFVVWHVADPNLP